MWTKWIIPIFGSRIIHVFAFILYYMHVSIKFYFFKIKWCFSCWNHSGYCTCDSMNSLVTRRSPWMFPSPHYLLGLGFDFLRGVFLALPAKWGLYSITQHTIARLAGSGSSSQFFIALLKAVQIGDSEGIINSQGRAHLLSCFIPLSPHCPVRGLSHSRFSWWRDSHGLFIQYSFPFSALLLILAHPPSLPLTSLSAGLGLTSPGWPELLILLLLSFRSWDYKHSPFHLLFVFLLCVSTSGDSPVHYREWHFPYFLCCGVSKWKNLGSMVWWIRTEVCCFLHWERCLTSLALISSRW